jgi:hypothetical protein
VTISDWRSRLFSAATPSAWVKGVAAEKRLGARRHQWDHDPTETAELVAELRHTEDEREERGPLYSWDGFARRSLHGPPASEFLTA